MSERMRALSGFELEAASDDLECEAATILGYMLFEYSRLDMELGLFLVWSDDGKKLIGLTKKLNEANFSKRLEFLEKLVRSKYEDAPAADLYAAWLSDAHGVRSLRNQLFHGRWGFMPRQQLVANVMGLPTSPDQVEARYSVDQLRESLEVIRALRSRLGELRESWPV